MSSPEARPAGPAGPADWDGAAYRAVSGLQEWLADRALARLDLTDAGRVLDVGCGDGRVTARIARRVPQTLVVGVDASPRMIAVAPAEPRLRFCLGNAAHLPFRDAFDVVVSFNALHWLPDQQRALAEVAGALHAAGRAYIVQVCAGPRPSLEQVGMDVTARPAWRQYFAGFTAPFRHPDPGAYAELARAAGLAPVELRADDLAWDFGTGEAFRRWATVGFGAWTAHLPADAVRDFMSEVAAAYATVSGSPSTFRFMQLNARLRKPT